jgi:hypothetical protein
MQFQAFLSLGARAFIKNKDAIRSLTPLLLAMPIASFGKCTKGSEFEPPLCPLRIEKISTIQIEENGAKAVWEQDPSVDCSVFKLDTKKVRKFFSKAKIADKQQAHYTLGVAPCYTSGTLKFASGKKAYWSINQMGTGSLATDDNNGLFLYCRTCSFKPFIPQ